MRKYRMFASPSLRDSALEKVLLFLKPMKFSRGKKIYKEDVSVADGIYFIINGDFEVT